MRPESSDSAARTELREMVVRLVHSSEQPRYQELMREHHYLGHLPKIGETLWYVASWREQWVALLSFSASALKCAARDRWIGWSFRQQYARLKLVVNNSRFLILPDWHLFNWGSRVLSLCQRRLPRDWEEACGHGVVLLETFVDPQRQRGTVYRAANWIYVGNSRGFRRTRVGYTATPASPKMVFLKLLRADARRLLCRTILSPPYHLGGSKMKLTAEQMRSLPCFFSQIPDPRRTQGRRHRLSTVLGIAAGAYSAGCAGTRPLRIGPKASGRNPGSASVAVANRAIMWCPASPSSATCSSASRPPIWIAPYNAGTNAMAQGMRVWPSTARPCATPWMSRASKLML